jgi:hypothetical protein
MKEKMDALKTVVKTYMEALQLKIRRDDLTGLINVTFYVLDAAQKDTEFSICLKDRNKDEYDIIDPPQCLKPLVDKYNETNDISSFMYEVREFAKQYVLNNDAPPC